MKYPYHVEYTKFGSPIMQLPKEVELVTTFLFNDVDGSIQEYYLSAIDRVLQGKVAYSEAGGNIYRLEIKKDFARVIDTLADDQTMNACIIETEELKNLIEVWCSLSNMLKRTTTVSASNKQKNQEVLEMYTPYEKFLIQNPDVERIAKEKELEGEMRGKIKGKIEGKVNSILTILNFRFPNDTLIELAKQALGSIHDIEVLGKLEHEALSSPDKQYIQKRLNKYLPQNKTKSTPGGTSESSTGSEEE